MAEALPVYADLDAQRLIIVAVLTFAGSIVAGLSGMGGGILVAIAITPVVGIKALVPTVAVTMLINHIARVWVFRREVVWRPAASLLAAAVPATVIGASIYVSLAPRVIAIIMGIFLISFVAVRRMFERKAWRIGTKGLIGVGGVYGLLAGATLGGGMLVIPALLGSGLTAARLIGTDAMVGLVIAAVKVTTFGTFELLTPELALIGTVVGVCSVPGVYLARFIMTRTSVKVHTLFIEALIVLGGISFLWRGLAG